MTRSYNYSGILHCSKTEEIFGSESPESIVYPVRWLSDEIVKHTEIYRRDGKPVSSRDAYAKIVRIINDMNGWPPNVRLTPCGKIGKLDAAIT